MVIRARSEEAAGTVLGSRADFEGRYRFDGLSLGWVGVEAELPASGRRARRPAPALLRLSVAEGRVHQAVGGDGRLVLDHPVDHGLARIRNVAAGHYMLTVVAGDRRTWSGTANVVPGVPAEIRIP